MMDLKKCKEYLRIVLAMENEIYKQKRLMEDLQRKIDSLGNSIKIKSPGVPIEDIEEPIGCGWYGCFGLGLIYSCVVFSAFISFYGCDLGSFTFITATGLIPIISFAVFIVKKIKKQQKSFHDSQRRVNEYSQAIDMEKARVAEENRMKPYFQAEWKKVANLNAASRETLDSFYALNMIHPKYRNFSMVASLYEYFDTGRCVALEGPDGAYNLLETESCKARRYFAPTGCRQKESICSF